MTEGKQTGQEPAKKSRRRIILIILGVVVISCCGISVLAALLGGDNTTAKPTVIVEVPAPGSQAAASTPASAPSSSDTFTPTPPPTDRPTSTNGPADVPTPVTSATTTLGPLGTSTPAPRLPTDAPKATVIPAATATSIPRPTETPTSAPIPDYQVVEIEDISVARAVRLRAVVTTEFPISIEQIGALCEQVVEGIKRRSPLNAAVVFLFDTRSLLSGGYSIARCQYAPNGVWTDALDAQKGDYSTHKYTYEYQPKVNDPQAVLVDRPTEEEYNLCQHWDELASELLPQSTDVAATETIVHERIAESNGVSVETVKGAVLKCTFWTWR